MSEPNVISSGRGPEHIAVLLGRLRLAWLLDHFPPRVVWALNIFINGFLTIALLALLAVVTGSPFVFPSLGPTAYLLFIAPLQQNSSPRNTILGHALGLACAMVPTSSQAPPAYLTACIPASTGPESYPLRSPSRPQEHSWFCCAPIAAAARSGSLVQSDLLMTRIRS